MGIRLWIIDYSRPLLLAYKARSSQALSVNAFQRRRRRRTMGRQRLFTIYIKSADNPEPSEKVGLFFRPECSKRTCSISTSHLWFQFQAFVAVTWEMELSFTNGRRNSGAKFTSLEFCVPFAQTVNRPDCPGKWSKLSQATWPETDRPCAILSGLGTRQLSSYTHWLALSPPPWSEKKKTMKNSNRANATATHVRIFSRYCF